MRLIRPQRDVGGKRNPMSEIVSNAETSDAASPVIEAVKPEEANLHPWWEAAPIPAGGMGDTLKQWAEDGLVARAVRTGITFYRGTASGIVGDSAKTVMDNIEIFQLGRRVYESVRKKGEQPSKVAWAWDSGAVVVDYYSCDDEIHVWAMSSDKKVVENLMELMRRYVAPRKPEGRVYIIGDTPMGPEFYSLGVASVPLERGNYEANTLATYDGAVEELMSQAPFGRLTIFDGPPGTGKTYLVRAILDSCPDAMFVFVLPNMVDALASPSLIPLLIRRKNSGMNSGPIVFILEDGDNVLTPRGKDNLSLISTLLNMTSGILGSMLDIRVLATTNSPKTDIDPALMRTGRLSQHMTVGALSQKHAKKIFKRLTGKEDGYPGDSKEMTLSDVYQLARSHGWTPPSATATKVTEGSIVSSTQFGESFMIYPGKRMNG
jgi:hypothetical protein